MAKVNSNSGNGNVATSKKFSYKELLAKAMGTTPDKVQTVEEITKGTDELFKKAQEKMNELYAGDAPFVPYKAPVKKNGKTSQEVMAEIEAQIIDKENADDAEEIEIVEVVPVVGKKKVIAQNSAQAQKLLSKKSMEAPAPVVPDETTLLSRRTGISKAKAEKIIEATPTPVVRTRTTTATPLSKMTVAQLKEMKGKISDVQLNKYLKIASKRDGVELTQVAPAKEVKEEPITRTRTNNPKPAPESKPTDAVSDLISKGKAKENRATLNELLLKVKGMTLAKVEESTGHLDDKEVVDLISKIKEVPVSKPTSKPEKKMQRTTGNPSKTPLSKMTLAELQEVKGTISDVQWNKYFKIASKREGGVAETIPTKGKAKTEVKEEKKVTRTRKITTAPAPEKEVPNAQDIFKLAVDLYAKLGAFLNSFEGFVK